MRWRERVAVEGIEEGENERVEGREKIIQLKGD